jgi:hypothetical protein
VDDLTRSKGTPPDDVILWCALLLEPILEVCSDAPDRMRMAQDFLEPIVERLNLPRRASDSVRRIVAMLPKLDQGRAHRMKKNALYPLAEEVWRLRRTAMGRKTELPVESSEKGPRPARKRRSRKPPA